MVHLVSDWLALKPGWWHSSDKSAAETLSAQFNFNELKVPKPNNAKP